MQPLSPILHQHRLGLIVAEGVVFLAERDWLRDHFIEASAVP
jgi:hypothetical protein